MTDERLNKSQLAKAFAVSLVTVDNWIRRGLPICQRTDREVIFDPVEVATWLQVRKTCDPELLNLSTAEIGKEIARTHARAWLWMWGDSARRSNLKIRNAVFALSTAVEGFEDGSDD